MRPYDPERPLFFIHVPKTGGETLASIFWTWVEKKRLSESVLAPRQDWPPGSIVSAHYDAARGKEFSQLHPGDHQRMTFLRDPFDQCVSWYFYWKNTQSGRMPRIGGAVFLKDYASSLVQFLDTNPFSMLNFLPRMSDPTKLDDFVFVGITERMQDCVNSLADILEKPHEKVWVGGRGTKDEPIPGELRGNFRNSHPKEYAVYDHAIKTWTPMWDTAV